MRTVSRVIVVEDDEDVMELLHDVLSLSGIAAIGIHHPDLVLDVARHEHPDLFVIDIMLPGISGISLAEELRRNGFEHTPMLALSASPIMRDLAVHTGLFNAALTKPFDIDRLMRCVQELLEHSPVRQLDVLEGPQLAT